MKKKDLIDYYKVSMPDHLKPYTGQAIELFSIANPGFEPFDRKNRNGIQAIAIYLHESKKDKKTHLPEIDLFPGSFFVAEKRIKYILPEIIKIRKELFAQEEPPFDYDSAINWIKKESRKEAIEFYKRERLPQEDVQKLKDKIRELIDDLNKSQNWSFTMGSKLITIPIVFKNGLYDEIITFPGTKLRRLALAISFHSENTNFSQFSLLMFILTGIKPIPPSYSITQEFSSYGGKTIEIKIFRPLKLIKLMPLFKIVGGFMPREKKIKDKNIIIYNFIEKRGPIPLTGKMEFWAKAWQEWNKIYPKEKYASSGGLRMAYLRNKKKTEI